MSLLTYLISSLTYISENINKNITSGIIRSKSLLIKEELKMTLVKWSPWREMATANNYFNRFFDNTFSKEGFDQRRN